ncbi:MAG: sodium:calcium antiporter [Acidobacteria bacterium]|nr:sodium:calcium antiporter [Acidobacteriota bacterium]
MIPALLGFLASGAVIVAAGTALAKSGDAIAEHTRLGRVWIGSVLLAGATSLPELTTDVAAVRLGVPDLAAGDLFGSSLANMLLLALLGLLPPAGRIFREASFDHAMAASLAIILNGLGALFVLAHTERTLLGAGPESALLLIVFVFGTRAVYLHTVGKPGPPATEASSHREQGAKTSLRRALAVFALAAAGIFIAAPYFAASAKQIAEMSGLGMTFVGTLLVGLSTSLPEFVTSFAAVRLGAIDLAVGNLFGSNAFNMSIFFAMDLAHPGGPVFGALEPVHAVTGLFAVVLTTLGLAAILFRSKRRFPLLEPGSILMLLVYFTAIGLLYAYTSGI